MIKMVCDRCGKEIKGTTYYTIYIGAEDINPVDKVICSTSTAIQNIGNTFAALLGRTHYCKECKDKFEAFMSNT